MTTMRPFPLATAMLSAVVLTATGTPTAFAATISSTFDTGTDGWLAAGDATTAAPLYLPTGGNPGGAIEVDDSTAGGVWYFDAPAKFLGDQSGAAGQTLTFDLYQRGSGSQFFASDVVLEGAGLTLTFDAPSNPLPVETWVSYVVGFDADAGWKNVGSRTSLSGPDATDADLAAVLGDLDALLIRGEYISGSDFGRLDNVEMTVVPVPPALWLLASAVTGLGAAFRGSRERPAARGVGADEGRDPTGA